MASLRQDSNGNFRARRRLPDDVREEYGRRFGPRLEAKFFARATVGSHKARQMFREWDAAQETSPPSARSVPAKASHSHPNKLVRSRGQMFVQRDHARPPTFDRAGFRRNHQGWYSLPGCYVLLAELRYLYFRRCHRATPLTLANETKDFTKVSWTQKRCPQ